MTTLKKLLEAIIVFLRYKTVKQENIKLNKETANNIEQEAEEKVAKKQKEVNDAIISKDEDKINSIINRTCKVIIISFMFTFLSGCFTEYVPVYVSDTDKVIYMEHEEKPGYWVPEKTMHLLLDYKIKYEAYTEAINNAKKSK